MIVILKLLEFSWEDKQCRHVRASLIIIITIMLMIIIMIIIIIIIISIIMIISEKRVQLCDVSLHLESARWSLLFKMQCFGRKGELGWTMCLCSCKVNLSLSLCQLIFMVQLHSHCGSCLLQLVTCEILASSISSPTRIFNSETNQNWYCAVGFDTACMSATLFFWSADKMYHCWPF